MVDRAEPMILNENIYGIRMIRTDMKKRSRVDVVNKNGFKLHTYRMNNVPFYEHKYLSWQNIWMNWNSRNWKTTNKTERKLQGQKGRPRSGRSFFTKKRKKALTCTKYSVL